jgi:DNA topoisomerase I
VQTVAVRLIVEREHEIRAFKSEEYWNLAARLRGENPPEFTAKARSLDGKKWNVSDQDTIDTVVESLRQRLSSSPGSIAAKRSAIRFPRLSPASCSRMRRAS